MSGVQEGAMKRQHQTDPNLFWCPKCQMYKTRAEFPPSMRRKYAIDIYCRYHRNAIAKEWRDSNIYKVSESLRKCKEKHLQKYMEMTAQWRENNPGKIKDYSKKYHAEHRKERSDKNKQWRSDNPDKLIKARAIAAIKRNKQDFTPQLVDLISQRIIAKRTLKQFKKWRQENESNCTDVHGK